MRINVYIHISKNNSISAWIYHKVTRTSVNFSAPGPRLDPDSFLLMSTKLLENCYILMEQEISSFCSNQSPTEPYEFKLISVHTLTSLPLNIYFNRYFHLHLSFQNHLFSSRFPLNQFCPTQPPLFDYPNNIWWVQVIKLQPALLSLSLWCKYSSQYICPQTNWTCVLPARWMTDFSNSNIREDKNIVLF
jgi:hypothetical protein